jgi:hypothetical protein
VGTAGELFSMPGSGKSGMIIACAIMLLEWRAFIKGKMEYAIQTHKYNVKTVLIDVLMIISCLYFCLKETNQFIYIQF